MFNDQQRLGAPFQPSRWLYVRSPLRKLPMVLLKDALLKGRLVSWVMDHQRSLWGVLTLRCVQISPGRGAVGGVWWMCPGSLGSIYQKISTDLWVVWAALAASPPTLADISIWGHCSVSGGFGDSVLYLVLSQCRSQEVCRLRADGFVLVLGVSDRSSVFSLERLLSSSNS